MRSELKLIELWLSCYYTWPVAGWFLEYIIFLMEQRCEVWVGEKIDSPNYHNSFQNDLKIDSFFSESIYI